MDPTSKERARPRNITIRPSDELFDRLDQYREEAGVSFQHIGILGLEMVLEKAKTGRALLRRKPARSA